MTIIGPGFDAGRLTELVDELDGDRVAAEQFADQFVQMLPQRIDRVTAAMRSGDRARITDALQGLRASAEMVGAQGLARVADRAYAQRRDGYRVDIAQLAAAMRREAAHAQQALARLVASWR